MKRNLSFLYKLFLGAHIVKLKTKLIEKQDFHPSSVFEVMLLLNNKLDIKYLNKINSILESCNLEDKLEIFSTIDEQYCGDDKKGNPKCQIEATYSIRCDGLNDVSKKKIVNLLKRVPYLKKLLIL